MHRQHRREEAQQSGWRGAIYEAANEKKMIKKKKSQQQVHKVRWGELQMRLWGGQECHSSSCTGAHALMAAVCSGQRIQTRPLCETACCKDKGRKDGNVAPPCDG